ncbi:MAG: hypothetical protein CYPHOPRED_003604 [Cyphobasidiales sp. Tagirdzhanova-0007]|nr:MAG: hypothetical protein CYPHOPRED_003604 [Cyphobasidiales sp. Tagirdzhanova-0007]
MPAPAFIQRILSSFPIVEYTEQVVPSPSGSQYPSVPREPTLWIYGPGIDKERESFDLACLAAQAQAAFSGVKVERRDLTVSEGAPGAILPALHLDNGDLLPSDAISGWIAKQAQACKGKKKAHEKSEDGGYSLRSDTEKDREENVNIQTRTYTSLIEAKLTPALLGHLYLTPAVYRNLTVPLYYPQTLSHGTPTNPASPLFTRYGHAALAKSHRLEVQAQIVATINKSGAGRNAKLDLEELQRNGEEAIQILADKMDREANGWFFGTA